MIATPLYRELAQDILEKRFPGAILNKEPMTFHQLGRGETISFGSALIPNKRAIQFSMKTLQIRRGMSVQLAVVEQTSFYEK